ncbi:hypothetical protein GCM10010483_52740 [Actinokineospora diospyrosa]
MGRVALIAVVAVVLAGVAVAVLLLDGRQVSGSAVPVSAAPLTSDQARGLGADLTSGDESRVRRAVAVSPEQPFDPGFVASLAAAPVELDAATFQVEPDGSAHVSARVGGARWTVWLVAVEGRWLISSTEAVQ